MAERYVGKWSKFVGCGTNGGITTVVDFKGDMTCVVEERKRGKPGTPEVSQGSKQGSWLARDGAVLVSLEGGGSHSWDAEDDFGGRYGFHKDEE